MGAAETSKTKGVKKVIKGSDIAPEAFEAPAPEKQDDLNYDLGNLAAFDEHPVDLSRLGSNPKQYLLETATENAQLLINKIFALPVEKTDVGPIATLPPDTTPIPRARPLPKPKVETRWEKFAREKGIKKRKKSRMVYDEQAGEYKAAWGYKRANDDSQDWAMEVKQGSDPNADPWTERKQAKAARVAKNLRQKANNVAQGRGRPGTLPTGIPLDLVQEGGKRGKTGTKRTLEAVQTSTASMGKFDEHRPGEGERKKRGKRRKFEAVVGHEDKEKARYDSVMNQILSKDSRKSSNEVNVHAPDGESKKRKKGKGSGRGVAKKVSRSAKKGAKK